VLLVVIGVLTKWLWKPLPTEQLQESPKVWARIMLHVFGGGALSAVATGALYGGCGYFAHRCWPSAFCEAAWKGPPWILVSGLAATPAAVLLWHWRTVQRSEELQRGAIGGRAQRFAEGVKLLSSADEDGQVAGVYTVFAIAEEDPQVYGAVAIETLSGFIRRLSPTDPHAPRQPDELEPNVKPPVESAFCCAWFDDADLTGADLTGASYDKKTLFPSGFVKEGKGMKLSED
jgi:hypothetical protein